MNAKEFLASINMHYEQQPFADLKNAVRKHMKDGLAGKPSSLRMIPTYLQAQGNIPVNEYVIVIDAGGTNLRIGLVHFNRASEVVIDAMEKFLMPGKDHEIDVGEFFDEIAGHVLPYCEKSSLIGFCLSYSCEMLPSGDGRLEHFSKEVRVRNSEGILVCEHLEAALKRRGALGDRKYRLINDTVAVMLGAKAVTDHTRYDDYIGFILGTGTNICYAEKCSAIIKNENIKNMQGEMIINMESGSFAQLLRGKADLIVDRKSEIPDDHIAEKMIGGGYFPSVISETLAIAASEGMFSDNIQTKLDSGRITMKDVDDFCRNKHSNNSITSLCSSEKEIEFCSEVVDMLLERAARISAAFLCAILEETGKGNKLPVCICAEGTTITKNPVLLPKIKADMDSYTGKASGAGYEFISIDDATLYGAAVAGLIK